jgi:hypothetical protein
MISMIKAIFGGGPSMIWNFVIILPVIIGGIWAFIDSQEEAAVTAVMYEQEKQTTATLADYIHSQSALTEKDQKAYANLTLVNEALQSAKEQAILEMNKAVKHARDGDCNGNDYAPARELWVLESLARELTKPESLYGNCAGAATGCAASRLRDAIEGRITEAAYNRENEIRGHRNGTDQVARESIKMRLEQRDITVLETTEDGAK